MIQEVIISSFPEIKISKNGIPHKKSCARPQFEHENVLLLYQTGREKCITSVDNIHSQGMSFKSH